MCRGGTSMSLAIWTATRLSKRWKSYSLSVKLMNKLFRDTAECDACILLFRNTLFPILTTCTRYTFPGYCLFLFFIPLKYALDGLRCIMSNYLIKKPHLTQTYLWHKSGTIHHKTLYTTCCPGSRCLDLLCYIRYFANLNSLHKGLTAQTVLHQNCKLS